jgi:peptide/nickel transport system permease protein
VVVGGAVVLTVMLLALCTPLIAPYSPDQIGVGRRLATPGVAHLLGTNEFDRDILSRVLYGARLTLYIGIVAVSIGLTCGVMVGAIAAYAGGWLGGLLMRAIDLLYTFPTYSLPSASSLSWVQISPMRWWQSASVPFRIMRA